MSTFIQDKVKKGDRLKCKKEGWLYEVIQEIPEVEGVRLSAVVLEMVQGDAQRVGATHDVVARPYLLERYRIVKKAA